MFVRPTNPISHRLARVAFLAACVAGLIVAAAGPLHRYLDLDIEISIGVFRYGFYIAVAAVALGLATIVPTRPGDRRRGFVAAFLAIVIGVAGAWMPVSWFLWSQQLPVINDISSDISDPPAMVALLALRRARDDIVVRIRADGTGTGSKIDIRSKSRAGESDLGVNARRIRNFIARLKAET